jgi:thiol-disulfide isomerase/thioredoxin
MYLFIGVNASKKEKYVVVDANNNHDFSDDHLYTFPLPDKPLTREEKADRALAVQITPDPNKENTVVVGLDPFNYWHPFKPTLSQDEQLDVLIVFTEYMQAQTQIDDLPVEIDAKLDANLFQRDLGEKTEFLIRYHDKANKPAWKNFSAYEDTLQINDKLYKLSRIEHPNIFLKEIGVSVDSSSVGSFLPIVQANSIKTNNAVSINDLIKGKYVFIDFWGSWCIPCVASIPKLKNFYENIQDRANVLMLGIASEDNEKGVKALRAIINSKKIEWKNLCLIGEERKITTSMLSKLNIQSFPTYLIVDKTGKIVYKNNNSKNTQEAIDFFMDLINK